MIKEIEDFKDLKRSRYFMIANDGIHFEVIKFISIKKNTKNKIAFFETNYDCIKLTVNSFNLFCYENKFEVATVIKDNLIKQLRYIEDVIKEKEYNVSCLKSEQ